MIIGWNAFRRQEQIIYGRDYDPKNYSAGGVQRFSHIPVSVVRQLVAEGLLDLQDQHNESPTVGEMLAFCSGEDEAIWFFHGQTGAPIWTDNPDCPWIFSRISLEGFESLAVLTPERREEFLRFNCRGETDVSEDGICWCWYD